MAEPPSGTLVSIQELNANVRNIIRTGFADSQFKIIGTVARVFESRQNHIYIDLTDDSQYALPCIVYASNRPAVGFTIEKNMRIEVVGTIGYHERESKVEMEVEGVRLIERNILKDFEYLKEELTSRKLWPKHAPRNIPKKIRKIALISGYKSAAIADFQKYYRQFGGKAEIVPVEVSLQGDTAPREIAQAIQRLNAEADVVGIVITRGGGSPMDLGVFDDLLVAEAILRSKIPILTGIGHEDDKTFADEISDMHGGTPTALAVLLAQYEVQSARTNLMMQVTIGVTIIVLIAIVLIFFLISNS